MSSKEKIQNPGIQSEIRDKSKDEKARVLYVDDSAMNLTLFEASFQNDFEIYLADSGPAGLEILKKENIAVIVSDQRMPGMSGTELLEIVAKEYPDIVRFILTAFTDYETVVESVNRGQVYGFFNKPFDADNVRISINKAKELYDLRTQRAEIMSRLEKANRELLSLDKSRTRFLNAITKEIRNPLQKIMSALHMLKNKADSKDLSELINFLDNSVSRLEGFTQSSNELVNLRAKDGEINATEISMKEIVEILIIEKHKIFNGKHIRLEVDDDSEEVLICADEAMIMRALTILVKGVVEDMEEDEKLLISTRKSEDKGILQFFMEVNEGVKPGDWSRFFENPGSGEFETHIEKILVKEILQAHQVKLDLENQDEKTRIISLGFPALNNN